MSEKAGRLQWFDLTVPEADAVRDFYASVVGWRAEPTPMGGYDDYSMLPPGADAPVAGVCHARGVNAQLPAAWIVYIAVEDLKKSLERCVALGGTILDGPRGEGAQRFCVIRDPAGAVCALTQA